MIRKVALSLFLAGILVGTGHAAGIGNAVPPGEVKGASSISPSYFEGIWVGAWPGYRTASATQDVTVSIARGGREGVFIVDYSWGPAPPGTGFPTQAGSRKAKGRVEGDEFVFGWKNKEGNDVKVTLKKLEENKVKAMLERSGPSKPGERPFNETTMNRR
jgi:hypothetical protein